MSHEHQDNPVRREFSTATLAHAEQRNQTARSEWNESRPMPSPNPPAEDSPTYPGESNGNPRLVAGNPAEIQSAQDSQSFRGQATSQSDNDRSTPLFSSFESRDFNSRWDAIQVGFVDEPRQAVQEADELMASAMHRLAEVFAEERARLEEQWDRGDSVSTEDLRVALQRYRSFFRRLLAI